MTREQIRAQVAETRARQGLGPTITDPDTLRQLAVKVADGLVRQKGAGAEHDDAGQQQHTRRRVRRNPAAAINRRRSSAEA